MRFNDSRDAKTDLGIRDLKVRNIQATDIYDVQSIANTSITRYSGDKEKGQGENKRKIEKFHFLNLKKKLFLSLIFGCYLISNCSTIWIFIQITRWAFEFEYETEKKYTITWLVERLAVYLALSFFHPLGDYLLKGKFCVAVSLNIHQQVVILSVIFIKINGLFNADTYKMMTNLPMIVYRSKIHNDLVSLDIDFPNSIALFLYNLSLFLAFSAYLCGHRNYYMALFVLPVFILISIGFYFFIRERGELTKIGSELKIKDNYLTRGITDGIERIRGLKYQKYFKIRMSQNLQRSILAELYMIGRSYWFSLRVFLGMLVFIVLPTFVYIALFYERFVSFPSNIIIICFTPLLPRIVCNLYHGLDQIKTNLCDIEDCIKISKFGKKKFETGVNTQSDASLQLERERTVEIHIEKDEKISENSIKIVSLDVFSIENRRVISSLNLTVSPGEHIALISDPDTPIISIFDIILRFLKEYAGDILLGNRSITSITRSSIRKQIHFSDHNCHLMKGTVKDNITSLRGKEVFSEEEYVRLVSFLKRYKFCEEKFEKYGYSMSINPARTCSRDKKLLSLADLLMTKKSFVLVDRVDWGLEEQGLMDGFEEIKDGFKEERKTVVMLCSKISTSMLFDRVLVFRKGVLVEQGPPDELLKDDGSLFKVRYDKEIFRK